ncbi:MAG: bifunctional phosphoribosylaminoimidazolecarboxamide formyltransferase/IMP cyclohydrolase [Planctomycetaceae bacterium]|nr:bifunctional phosphoribosylaminoimidazolecarboxamide formyltransferase/IMP cyclohydrolase [Planctomycetales bacterium]MCB9874631.1 bifunctional phosphoribosylaminoimidazolecarboxamide formyltransferase/IMP cyclohydrolase [Planctomycetaceae bacterium]MCB9936945.1 bifunctional phosphoribosylaminoimidazolecarboxamide formyltransferase/IMP cyclohydrolase [Planctomycetaceae bacterium]HRX81070.1 bifunctional phosphoribosylaminoimidazolecarboxamide formyltransferase/IMP cyclohydrolase [Pirellulaceae
MDNPTVRRALISVSDKLGLAGFAYGLSSAGVEIYSTGGTRKHLESQGLRVYDVADYTGFPEMMDGRLKTLHPKIFGGILCRHDRPDDMEAIDEQDIVPFELIVVNLYPFEATISREGVTRAEAIEQIDIGGPSLVRAAAKNHKFVSIATHPEQYSSILEEISRDGHTSLTLRTRLASEAFARTAAYDRAIADYFCGETNDGPFAPTTNITLHRRAVLRYGENPHQQAALYSEVGSRHASLVTARQLNGKELSYNNLLDLDSALTIARSLPGVACSVIKHNNPCGAASAATLVEATQKALAGDPVSAFGSVIGFNRIVDVATAEFLATPGLFVEAIVAPDFEAAAVGVLTSKPKWRSNVRLMQVGRLEDVKSQRQFRHIDGGMLVQDADSLPDPEGEWKVVTEKQPTDEQLAELRFGWAVVRHVKSNAITLSKDQALCGVGAGQMSRVDSVEIAIRKAGDRVAGSVLSSDAFFPFPDSIHKAAEAGVSAIIQPGGSKNDDDVIAACNEVSMPMIFTGRRHFKH